MKENSYIIEVVHRYNLSGTSLPKEFNQVGSGNFFMIYHGEVTEQQLGMIIAHLEEAEKNGDIITYYYQQK